MLFHVEGYYHIMSWDVSIYNWNKLPNLKKIIMPTYDVVKPANYNWRLRLSELNFDVR